jgi:hypothetical protein
MLSARGSGPLQRETMHEAGGRETGGRTKRVERGSDDCIQTAATQFLGRGGGRHNSGMSIGEALFVEGGAPLVCASHFKRLAT